MQDKNELTRLALGLGLMALSVAGAVGVSLNGPDRQVPTTQGSAVVDDNNNKPVLAARQ